MPLRTCRASEAFLLAGFNWSSGVSNNAAPLLGKWWKSRLRTWRRTECKAFIVFETQLKWRAHGEWLVRTSSQLHVHVAIHLGRATSSSAVVQSSALNEPAGVIRVSGETATLHALAEAVAFLPKEGNSYMPWEILRSMRSI